MSDVRPLLTVATYLDDQTGFEIYQEVTGKSFNPLLEAPEEVKRMNGGKSELFMQVRGSKFVKYQECKVQECPDEVSGSACCCGSHGWGRRLGGEGQLGSCAEQL